ncbi:replication initiator protein A [Deinococcus pimensis]|uniref:replication initiator protein A n=1 Tax=Deinococcus pimensis TaxID=309888 RepID=UPI000480CD56|nr:replication initiator protein A [Deinococcus pimensis]
MTDALVRIDDLNLARLNLISALDQVDGQRDWAVTYEVGERLVRVSCLALPEFGIPHGVDNDVNVAILDYFNQLGQPTDGTLEISATQLMRLCGFHRTGPYYAMLRESLDRLHTTNFMVSGGWRDHPNRRWTTAKFHIIESLKYTNRTGGMFDERTVIRLKLADDIVASIRGGYTKPLNLEFMQSLSRPRTRILFRVLDAMRVHPERPEEIVDHFEVGLLEWADQCKMNNQRPDMIRRALEGPHQELIRRGYLTSVTYDGRGRQQRLRYEFAPDFMPLSPAVLTLLGRHGVADGVARQLARTYGASTLMRAVERFETLVASGQLKVKKTAAAALVHLIKHPDQYPELVGGSMTPPRPAVRQAPQPEPTEPVEDLLARELAGLSEERRADLVVKRLGLYYKGKFSPMELDVLRQAVMSGRLDPHTVLQEALRRLASLEAQTFVDTLRVHLASLEAEE